MGLRIRTVLLLGLLTGVDRFLVGQLFGGRGGATFALGFAALMNFAAYWFPINSSYGCTGPNL